jgi:hypothetical protein
VLIAPESFVEDFSGDIFLVGKSDIACHRQTEEKRDDDQRGEQQFP